MVLSERDLDILSELISSVQLMKGLREISTELTDKEVENLNDYVMYYWNVIDPIKGNKAPYINKISEEVENTIDTIIKRHREEFSAPSSGKVTIDYRNLMQYFKRYVLTKTDDELISICGLKIQNSISDDGPQFILPNGDVLLGTVSENGNSDMHSRLIEYVCDKTFENEFGSRFHKDYQDYNVEDVLVMSVMTYERGWLRVNPGTRSVEDRFYCVLPNKVTSAQYGMLEQFLDLGSIKTNKVLIFATSYRDDHTYYFDNNTTDEIIKKIKRYYSNGYFVEDLKEELLLEKTRNDLINKSKNADSYKDQSKGKNRYERRRLSRIATSVAQYNKIDMDAFFKRDILTVGIDVNGETDDYVVTMRFKDVLQEIQREVKANNGKLEFKLIAKAMSRVFNTGDVQIHCTCPDAKYRQNYWQWKNGDGTQYEPRPSDKTNPNDTKGAGCKHTLLVLSNLDWIMKVSSVLNNYIKYCQKNLQNNYATYMFPKIYGVPYNKGVQMSIFDTGLLPQDQKTLTDIATTNMKDKDAKGRWIKGNSYVFQKNPNTPPKRVVDPNQLTIDDIENQDTKKKELVASAPVGTTTQEVDTKKQEQENGKDTKKKEMDTTIYRRALTIDDFDEEGNLVGNGVLIKDKRKNKPGAGRPKKVRQDDPDQLRLNFDDLDDEEND